MAENLAWYAGQCVKRHDLNMTVKVIAMRSDSGWSLLENPQKLLPKTGEVEVRLATASGYQPNSWVSFQISHKEPRGKWKASTYRNLMPFLDLQETGSLDELRSRLTEEGVDGPDHAGVWVVRYSEDRVIMLSLMRSPDNRYRMVSSGNFYVYAYESEYVYRMPSGAGEVFLYELKRGIECLEEVDWSPDEGYIKRIVRALAGAHDSSSETVVDWLKRHADEATGRVGSSTEDRLAALQAARSGELAKRLLADQTLLREITDALLADPRIQARLESETQAIAEQERQSIRTALAKDLEQEAKTLREERLSAIDTELKAWQAEQYEALRNQLKQDMKSSMLAMEGRVVARQAEMESELEALRNDLQQGLNTLAAERKMLQAELETITAQIGEEHQTLVDLQARKVQAVEEIERLKEEAATIQVPKSVRLESALRLNPAQGVPTLDMAEMQQAIKACVLLTAEGQERMAQFFALMLAGETPVLYGQQTQDFLLAAEALLSSGRSVRLEADPTVITFEDLWLRAGTQLPTALTHGLELTRGHEPTTVLAVIEHAERSGARFWLPALADRTRRGELPRRFFACVTVEDEDCEEAHAIRSQAPWLQVSGTIAAAAPALAPMVLSSANVRQLDPGERPLDLMPAMTVVSPLANQLTLANGLRLARTAAEWIRLNQGARYEETPAALAELFMNQHGRDSHTQPKS